MLTGRLFCFISFCCILCLSRCGEVSFLGWWTKEFFTWNKSGPTTHPLRETRWGSGVGGWVADMAKEVSDTQGSRKGWPHLLGGDSVLQLPRLQPTWSEKLLMEYLNLGPGSPPPRQHPAHPHRLTQLNDPSDKLWGSRGWNLPTPSALPLCQPPAQEWLEAARQWG